MLRDLLLLSASFSLAIGGNSGGSSGQPTPPNLHSLRPSAVADVTEEFLFQDGQAPSAPLPLSTHCTCCTLKAPPIWLPDTIDDPESENPPDPGKPFILRICSVSGSEFGCKTARPSPQNPFTLRKCSIGGNPLSGPSPVHWILALIESIFVVADGQSRILDEGGGFTIYRSLWYACQDRMWAVQLY
jgi:hypothetical protein